MTEIAISLVKELRKCTGAGITSCKKALIETNGNIALAIEVIRKSNVIKAAQRGDNLTTEGVVITKIAGGYGIILEINCQTDFVARDENFQVFSKKALNTAFADKITDVNLLKTRLETELVALINKVGENINIRRIAILKGDMIGFYQHGVRIGVLVTTNKDANEKIIKQLAMHIAASEPEFIKPDNIPIEVIKKEYQFQLEIALQSGSSKEVLNKIIEGRMKKFINRISLINQQFILDPNITIDQLLKEHSIDVTGFIRFKLGENENININHTGEVALTSKILEK